AFPVARFDSFVSTILPALALATTPLAFIARLMRSSMLDVLHADFIKTAKSKGLSERVVTYRHAIRNAILPVVSFLGPLVASILTGSFIVEKIFAIPGKIDRSEEHTSELQSRFDLVCRLLLEKKKKTKTIIASKY